MFEKFDENGDLVEARYRLHDEVYDEAEYWEKVRADYPEAYAEAVAAGTVPRQEEE